MRDFLSGANVVACLVAALFFLRFWRETRDRLFAFFALAFAVLAANWAALVVVPAENEARTVVYGVRLLAFVLILIGVIDKNRSGR